MKSIVTGYACGVFDLYHAGHARLISNAKSFCDRLVIGLSTDELALSKGKKPIYSYEERREILLSVKGVDAVIPQINFDKYEAWKRINYGRLFVGDDWYGDSKWKEYETKLSEHDVDVIYLPYTSSISSTLVRSKIFEANNKERKEGEFLTKIIDENIMLACVMRNEFDPYGTSFITSDELELQLGYIKYKKGHKIEPHIHKKFKRQIMSTCEGLFIKSGKVKVHFYNKNKKYVDEEILNAGDTIMLFNGGHSFEFLEESRIIEIKQGPYAGDQDKSRL